MLLFLAQRCELLPISLSLWFTLPPTPRIPPSLCHCVKLYTEYTYPVCKEERVWGSGPQTDKHLPKNPFTTKFF
jgi:hypothetical protein